MQYGDKRKKSARSLSMAVARVWCLLKRWRNAEKNVAVRRNKITG
jgi:hypothetical protein